LFTAVDGGTEREDLEYERSDRSDAKEVWKVVVQDRHVRAGNNEFSTRWNLEGRDLVRGDVSTG
jgi:hypothetical protein